MQPIVSIPDDSVPQGMPVVEGTVVPSEETLPQTGESSSLPYVMAGAGLILFGLLMRRRSAKNAE